MRVSADDKTGIARTAACPNCGRLREGAVCRDCGLDFLKWRAYRVRRLREFVAGRMGYEDGRGAWCAMGLPFFGVALWVALMVVVGRSLNF